MATTYDVRLRLHSDGPTSALRDVLAQAFDDDDEPPVSVEQPTEGDHDLLVAVLLDAEDSSLASTAARERVGRGLLRVGISEQTLHVVDVDVRASS